MIFFHPIYRLERLPAPWHYANGIFRKVLGSPVQRVIIDFIILPGLKTRTALKDRLERLYPICRMSF